MKSSRSASLGTSNAVCVAMRLAWLAMAALALLCVQMYISTQPRYMLLSVLRNVNVAIVFDSATGAIELRDLPGLPPPPEPAPNGGFTY